MRVGLISKPEHCRPHVKAIKALGLKVEVLGGDPGLTIPSRVDVVVVRPCSISHSAFNVAKAWEREGGTVLYVEGAVKAAEAVEEMMAGEVRGALNKLMDKHGWIHWYLPCQWDGPERAALGFHDPALFKVFDGVPKGTIRGAIASLAKRRGWQKVSQGDATAGFPGRPIQVWVAEDITPEAGRALDTFLVQVSRMRAASGPRRMQGALGPELPKVEGPLEPEEVSKPELSKPEVAELLIPEVYELLISNGVVADIKTEVDSNTRDILGVLGEVSEIQNKLNEAVSSSEFERRSQALAAVEKDLKDLKGSIDNALVEMMDHIDRVRDRCAVLESKAATSSGLANRIKALEDRSVGAAFRTAIEERISALEEGSGPAESQSTDPFKAIEDIKRKLSASGFRGTLTLTIGEEG